MVRLKELPNISNGCGWNEDEFNAGGFNETPLTELSSETRKQLCCMLNRKKVLRSEEGYERDWRGIASLSHQRNYVNEQNDNPMERILNSWARNSPETANFGHLEKFLGVIDRWDVRDDIQENLLKDTQRYNLKKRQKENSFETPKAPISIENNNNEHLGQNLNILTGDDVECLQNGLPLPKYNACVLYAEADIEYAIEIMNNLEHPRYNFKLFLRHRDLLPGVLFEFVELSQFMATRCNHLIVLLTEEFQKSPENTFLLNFTQKLQIEKNTRKIIPIVYSSTTAVPQTLDLYTRLNYSKHSSLYNFWEKLAKALHDVNVLSMYQQQRQTQMLLSPTAPEARETETKMRTFAPETPRILLNDKEVVDFPDTKLPPMEKPVLTGQTSTPLPELKTKKMDKLIKNFKLNFGKTPRSATGKVPLRHAQSNIALNVTERERTLSGSSSTLSVISEGKKSSSKGLPKIFKKVFSRSSKQLQLEIPS